MRPASRLASFVAMVRWIGGHRERRRIARRVHPQGTSDDQATNTPRFHTMGRKRAQCKARPCGLGVSVEPDDGGGATVVVSGTGDTGGGHDASDDAMDAGRDAPQDTPRAYDADAPSCRSGGTPRVVMRSSIAAVCSGGAPVSTTRPKPCSCHRREAVRTRWVAAESSRSLGGTDSSKVRCSRRGGRERSQRVDQVSQARRSCHAC